jgi:hypothetical protein
MSTQAPEKPAARAGAEPSPEATVYALDTTSIVVGTPNGPGIYLAPVGTAGPTDTTTAWPAAWSVLGYASDTGPVIGQNTNKQDIIPWQSMSPVRSVVTSREITLQFILWQLNQQTLSLYFNAAPGTLTTGTLVMPVKSADAGKLYAVGLDVKDGSNILRISATRANLTANGNMAITRGATVPLDCTLTMLDDNGTTCTVVYGPNAT